MRLSFRASARNRCGPGGSLKERLRAARPHRSFAHAQDGIVYDAKKLLAHVEKIVADAKKK